MNLFKGDPDDDAGTDVDGVTHNRNNVNMEGMESPSSELEKLGHDGNSEHGSMESGHEGMYDVNPYTNNMEMSVDSLTETDGLTDNVSETASADDKMSDGGDSDKSGERKSKHDRRMTDSALFRKELLDDKLNESFPGSRPSSAASSAKSGTPSKEKDHTLPKKSTSINPLKREKEREREEKIRLAQVKIAEDRQRKIEEMREQQRVAQENRERQLESRRRKIEELKRREEDRRRQVDDRRRTQEEIDKVKKEAILCKAKERLTRYEQWKAQGRKGVRRHALGFGSRAPREVCLPLDSRRSSSQSTLRRSPNSSDYDSYFNRRAVSASSVVRRHCCIDINKLTQGTGFPGDNPPSKKLSMSLGTLYHKRNTEFASNGDLNTKGVGGLHAGAESMMASAPPIRHKSSVSLGSPSVTGVKMRDTRSSPRKPRPSSVATSMPSFVRVETDSPKSSRSKSTDRDTSKTRPSVRKEDDKADGKAATLPRPYDRKKIEERRQEVKKKQEERKEKEREARERMSKSETRDEAKEKVPVRMSRSFIERMSVPKKASPTEKKEVVPRDTPSQVKVIRRTLFAEAPVPPPRKAKAGKEKSKSVKDSPAKPAHKDDSSETKSETMSMSPKSVSPAPSGTPPYRVTPTIQVEEVKVGEDIGSAVPGLDITDAAKSADTTDEGGKTAEHTVTFGEPTEITSTSPRSRPPDPKQPTPEPKPALKQDTKSTPKTDKEREMEEYKAKLAEKRRMAREKAEREAEIERLKQEEKERQEEERQRLEEERQRQEEEEALRLAAEARIYEEERLQRAIEAEEKRKREEAERLEQERVAKEEAEKKAKEEAERLEKERQERSKKEEEERLERKKRLEMIMKRVKPGATPDKSRNESPTRVLTGSSSRTSLVSSEDEKGDDSAGEDRTDSLKPDSDSDTPKFKSPLLQKLTATKTQNGDSTTPKFKSPLLQSIMDKTKLGARLSQTKLNELGRSDENLSKSQSGDNLEDLRVEEGGDTEENNNKDTPISSPTDEDIVLPPRPVDPMAMSMFEPDLSNGTMDSTDTIEHSKLSDSVLSDRIAPLTDTVSAETEREDHVILDSSTSVSDQGYDPLVTDSQFTASSAADSAVSMTFNGVSSPQNGDVYILPKDLTESRELVDSSISMRTADSFGSSQTGSIGGSLVESQNILTTSDSNQFEDIIDLNVGNKTHFLNHSEDVLNLNSVGGTGNGEHMRGPGDESPIPAKPFIAFEDNATRRQDVPDLLS